MRPNLSKNSVTAIYRTMAVQQLQKQLKQYIEHSKYHPQNKHSMLNPQNIAHNCYPQNKHSIQNTLNSVKYDIRVRLCLLTALPWEVYDSR